MQLTASPSISQLSILKSPRRLLRRLIFLCRNQAEARANGLLYRIAGLPTAVRAMRRCKVTSAASLRRAYARWYWRPRNAGELVDLGLALLLWPVAFLVISALFLGRNAQTVSAHSRRSVWRQFFDQVRLYVTAGVLPSCYYTFALHDQPTKRHARGFLFRCETKGGVFHVLNRRDQATTSLVRDKTMFADHCQANAIATVPTLAVVSRGQFSTSHGLDAFRVDLFVKPAKAKGGRGAQRWDYVGNDSYRNSTGSTVTTRELFALLRRKSAKRKLLVQPRLSNHPELAGISNGALSTVRVLTCLDERGQPEMISAMVRMAIGSNRVVDNAHKGGIAAAVDLRTGKLGSASSLAGHATCLERHPTTHASITGLGLPYWQQLRPLVERAHSTMPGRVLIGWDVAITAEGLVIIEANGSPGLEMMQRTHRRGFIRERFGELLAYHAGTARIGRRLEESK